MIPNMDGFPNGRRLEDDVTTIELQALGGVVLAAIGLWYDDFTPGVTASPVTPRLMSTLGFNAGVTKNDTTLKAVFPYEQSPWRGFRGTQYAGTKQTNATNKASRISSEPNNTKLSVTVLGNPVSGDDVTGEISGAKGENLEMDLVNTTGQIIGHQSIDVAGKSETKTFKLGKEAGMPGSEPFCWSKKTLGHLYESTGELTKAQQQYDDILAVRPSYAFAYGGQARILKAKKQYDKALEVLDKAAKIMPEFSFHEEMAEIYDLQGNHEKALAKYEEVVKMLDEDAKSGHAVDLELCKLYTKAGNFDMAMKHGLIEYKKRPRNIDVNHAMAVLAFKINDFKKAKEYLTVAMSTGSKDAELLLDAGKIDRSLANRQFGYEPIVVANR